MKRLIGTCVALAVLGWNIPAAMAQQSAATARQQPADEAVSGKYTFVVFYKVNNAATQSMMNAVTTAMSARQDLATVHFASTSDPDYKEMIAKYSLGRAPMPFTLAIAPNGAVTGAFSQKVTAEELEAAFVSPAMMHCMRASQEGQVVLIHIHMSERVAIPSGVRDFCADKLYKDRVSMIALRADDEREKSFLSSLELDATLPEPVTVMIAPPGAFVGKFAAAATKEQMAAALHEAGKCCEDENCKHNKSSQATKQTGSRRN